MMKSFRYKKLLHNAPAPVFTATMLRGVHNVTRPRGAALITAMLITLVLSGLGLIALHSVNDSTWKTASYRSRQQASQISDAVANLSVYRLGESAEDYIGPGGFAFSLFEVEKNDAYAQGGADSVEAAEKAKTAVIQRGPYIVFGRDPDSTTEENFNYLFTGNNSGTSMTGTLFDDAIEGTASPSFGANSDDSSLHVDYRVILRDVLDGAMVPDSDRSFCYRKVTVASQGRIVPNEQHVQNDKSWKARTNMASNQNIIEVMAGPVDCSSSGGSGA